MSDLHPAGMHPFPISRREFLRGTAVLAAAWAARPAAAEEKAASQRVLCFNIRYKNSGDLDWKSWSSRVDAVAQVMRDAKASVVGLQEALRSQLNDLHERLPEFGEIGVGRDDGKQAGEFCAIFYRKADLSVEDSGTFWLSETPEVAGSKHWGNHIVRICTWARLKPKNGGREFFVFNAHFDHESEPSRQKSAALVMRRVAERKPAESPVIVMGDFNADEGTETMKILTSGEPKLTETWRAMHPHEPKERSGTFHGWSGNTDGPKIDAILTGPGWKTLSAEIVRTGEKDKWPSDHFPVFAELAVE